mgnify:FL=1
MKLHEGETVDFGYYDLHGNMHNISLAPGDVQWICNILFNYEQMFDDFIEDSLEWAEDLPGWRWKMQISCDRIHKIRMQVEKGIDYSTEEHWKKCLKKRSKKEEDIGGDALELAFKRTIEKKNEVPKQPKAKKENVQMNLFDMEIGQSNS